jgi:hypothetical protein
MVGHFAKECRLPR